MSKIGLADGIALAAARDADKTFKEQVCQPEQETFEKKLNRIFKELTDLFLLKLNELTLTDENTQSQIDERRRKTGTETGNEQRVRRGHERGSEGCSTG
jgi:capsid portal protein